MDDSFYPSPCFADEISDQQPFTILRDEFQHDSSFSNLDFCSFPDTNHPFITDMNFHQKNTRMNDIHRSNSSLNLTDETTPLSCSGTSLGTHKTKKKKSRMNNFSPMAFLRRQKKKGETNKKINNNTHKDISTRGKSLSASKHRRRLRKKWGGNDDERHKPGYGAVTSDGGEGGEGKERQYPKDGFHSNIFHSSTDATDRRQEDLFSSPSAFPEEDFCASPSLTSFPSFPDAEHRQEESDGSDSCYQEGLTSYSDCHYEFDSSTFTDPKTMVVSPIASTFEENQPINLNTGKKWLPIPEAQMNVFGDGNFHDDEVMSESALLHQKNAERKEELMAVWEGEGSVISSSNASNPCSLLPPLSTSETVDDLNVTESSSMLVDQDFCLEKSNCPPPEGRLISSSNSYIGHGHAQYGPGFYSGKDGDDKMGQLLLSNFDDGGNDEDDSIEKLLIPHACEVTKIEQNQHIQNHLQTAKNDANDNEDSKSQAAENDCKADNLTNSSQGSKLTLGILAQISGLVDFDDDDQNTQQYGTTYPSEDDEDVVGEDEVERAVQINDAEGSMSIPKENHTTSHDLKMMHVKSKDEANGSSLHDFTTIQPMDGSGIFSPFKTNLSVIQNQSTHHMDDSGEKNMKVDTIAPRLLDDAFDDADGTREGINRIRHQGADQNHISKSNFNKLADCIKEAKTETTTETSGSSDSGTCSRRNSIEDVGEVEKQSQLTDPVVVEVEPAVEEIEFCVSNIKNTWKQRELKSLSNQVKPNINPTTTNEIKMIEVAWPSNNSLSPKNSKESLDRQNNISFEDDFFVDNDEDTCDKWNLSIGSGKLLDQSLSFNDFSSFDGTNADEISSDGFLSASSLKKLEKKKDSLTPLPPFWRSHPRKLVAGSIESKVRQRLSKSGSIQKKKIEMSDLKSFESSTEVNKDVKQNGAKQNTKRNYFIKNSSSNITPMSVVSSEEKVTKNQIEKSDSIQSVSALSTRINLESDKENEFSTQSFGSTQLSSKRFKVKRPSEVKSKIKDAKEDTRGIPSKRPDSGEKKSPRASFRDIDEHVHRSSRKYNRTDVIQNIPSMTALEGNSRKGFKEDTSSSYSKSSSVNEKINSLRGLLKTDIDEDALSNVSKASRTSSIADRIAAFETRSGSVSTKSRLRLTQPPRSIAHTVLSNVSNEVGLW